MCVCMAHVWWWLRESEEGLKSSGFGVAGSRVLPGVGAGNGGPLEGQYVLFIREQSPQPHHQNVFMVPL